MTAALVVLLALAPADSLAADCPGGTVVTRAALAASGAFDLPGALRLAGVPGVSVDGFDADPIGGALPFHAAVRVLVDGVPVARGGGPEEGGLTALPVVLAEVEAVVVCPGDGLAAGRLGGPWIDIRTRAPSRAATAALALGNEVGDPGPARYLTRPRPPNIERWGPVVEASAGRAVRAVGAYRQFLPTDPAILPRTRITPRPKRRTLGAAFVADTPGLRVRAAGRAAQDLAFAPGLAAERPFVHTSAQVTASGARRLGALDVRGHVHAARLALTPSARDTTGFDPDWAETRVDAALAARRGALTVGAGLDGAWADGVDGATVARAWARRGALALSATAADGAIGGGIAADVKRPLAARWSIRGSASARRALPAEARTPAAWRGRGYGRLGLALSAPGPDDVARARLAVRYRTDRVEVWGAAEALAAAADVALDVPGAQGVRSRARGTAAVATVGARWRGAGLSTHAEVRARGAVAGTDAFRALWDRLPRLAAALTTTARPDDRLALWARLAARTATTWRGFEAPTLPTVALLDLGLRKRFAGDHLVVTLGGRNLLGADDRSHPLGATLAPRLFVRAEARL